MNRKHTWSASKTASTSLNGTLLPSLADSSVGNSSDVTLWRHMQQPF